MRRVHIVGRKNSGKTTLIVELVGWLTEQGRRVGTIKHTHHHHELDTPGKDSFRHREAGAEAVGILAPNMQAAFWPCRREEASEASYARLDHVFADCAIVLVEGDLEAAAPKLEVWRSATGAEPLARSRADIAALITDDPVDIDLAIVRRSRIGDIGRQVLAMAGLEPSDKESLR
jgi:molybdopterin-guanine dinucleotide biosynthesis protein MobB